MQEKKGSARSRLDNFWLKKRTFLMKKPSDIEVIAFFQISTFSNYFFPRISLQKRRHFCFLELERGGEQPWSLSLSLFSFFCSVVFLLLFVGSCSNVKNCNENESKMIAYYGQYENETSQNFSDSKISKISISILINF